MKAGLNFFLVSFLLVTASWAQNDQLWSPPEIDVQHYDLDISIEPERGFLHGVAEIRFNVLQDVLAPTFDFNRNLSVINVTDESGERFNLAAGAREGTIRVEGVETLIGGSTKTLRFDFEGLLEPEQYAFLDVPVSQHAVIDSQGAVLLTEGRWFPSHRLPNDVATAMIRVRVPLGFTVVSAGTLQPIESAGMSEIFTWSSERPLSRIPVVVARYFREVYGEQGIPLTFFVTEEFEGDLEPVTREIRKVANFLSSEFGPVPFQQLTIAEVRRFRLTSSGSQQLLLVESELLEAPQLPVFDLARHVATQWWGLSVRPQRPMDMWIKDGFSTYAALRYLQQEYPERYQGELARQAVEALKHQEEAPIISGLRLEPGSSQYESIIASKGAWVLYMLSQLMGPEQLHARLKDFYVENAGQAVSINDFVSAVQAESEEDYRWFFLQWLESVGIPEFRLDYTVYKLSSGGFRIRGHVEQNLDLFRMPVDMRIETKGEEERKELLVSGNRTSFEFETDTLPLKLEIDPYGKVLMDSPQMRVAVHIALGRDYQQAGEFVSATEEYEKAIDLDPRSSLAHFRLGEVFFQQHSYNNAANSFRDTLNGDLKPEWVETWTHIYLGKIYDVLGQRQRALAEYQKAINSGIDYNGAQAEAEKYREKPYTAPSSVLTPQ